MGQGENGGHAPAFKMCPAAMRTMPALKEITGSTCPVQGFTSPLSLDSFSSPLLFSQTPHSIPFYSFFLHSSILFLIIFFPSSRLLSPCSFLTHLATFPLQPPSQTPHPPPLSLTLLCNPFLLSHFSLQKLPGSLHAYFEKETERRVVWVINSITSGHA